MVRHAARAALASRAAPTVLVTGHLSHLVAEAVRGLAVTVVHNSDYQAGLSTSLRAGIKAVPEVCAGAVVLLGDMPNVGSDTVDALIAAAERHANAHAAEATVNPVRPISSIRRRPYRSPSRPPVNRPTAMASV